jgi:hypothetical protein
MSDEEYPCDPGYCQIAELHEHIKALTAENKRLGQQCEGLMQAGMNNGQALIIAEAKLAKAVQALDRIAGKAPYADDPYDIARAALAELKGDKT